MLDLFCEWLFETEGNIMPNINGKKIRPIIADSGTFGFYGEGYWWHWIAFPFICWLKWFGTFVSKTVTAKEREGNMPLKDDGQPREWFPKCIFLDWKRFWRGGMLNAVGLSNFGIMRHLLWLRMWQPRRPWFFSVMPMGATSDDKLEECRVLAGEIAFHMGRFTHDPIVVVNISCPNTGEEIACVGQDVSRMLEVFGCYGIRPVVKVAVNMPLDQVMRIAEHNHCAGIHVTNTVPWAELPDDILKRVFPDCWDEDQKEWVSPLAEYGGGGYSGKDLLPMVSKYVYSLRQMGMEKPIIAGGGVFSCDGVGRLRDAGADIVSVASPVLLRFWKIPGIVAAAWLYDVVEKRRA